MLWYQATLVNWWHLKLQLLLFKPAPTCSKTRKIRVINDKHIRKKTKRDFRGIPLSASVNSLVNRCKISLLEANYYWNIACHNGTAQILRQPLSPMSCTDRSSTADSDFAKDSASNRKLSCWSTLQIMNFSDLTGSRLWIELIQWRIICFKYILAGQTIFLQTQRDFTNIAFFSNFTNFPLGLIRFPNRVSPT